MTITLTAAIFIAGVDQPIGTQLTLATAMEAELVNRGAAGYVGDNPAQGGRVPAQWQEDASGNLSLLGPDGGEVVSASQYGYSRNFNDTNWTLLTDFSEAWTSNASGTTSLVDGGVVGLKARQWDITATGASLTYPSTLPAGSQFALNTVKTVGLLVEADSAALSQLDIYFAGVDFSAANNRALRFPAPSQTLGGLMMLTGHVDRTAAESSIATAIWPSGFDAAFTATTQKLAIANGSAGTSLKLHGIFIGGKSRPKVMFGFDMWAKDSTNLYDLVFPQTQAHGWRGYLAPPGEGYSTITAAEIAQTVAMYAAGWDVINHSYSHQTPDQLGTYTAILADYTLARSVLVGLGFHTAKHFGAWPLNSTNATGKQVIEDMGYKMWRGLTASYQSPMPYNIPHVGHRYETPSWDMSGHTGAETVAAIRAAVREGVSLNLFTHSVYQTGDAPGTDPGNGAKMTGIFQYDIWESTWNMIRAEIRAQELAGALDVVTPSEWYAGATGEMIFR